MGVLSTHRRMMTIDGLNAISVMHAGRLGAADWWDPTGAGLCVWAAYQPKSAASFAASLVDLTGNGNNAGDPGGANTPGWDAVNGWRFDGVANYLTTTFVPQDDQSQSGLAQFTNAANIGMLFGMTTHSSAKFYVYRDPGGNICGYANGGSPPNVPPHIGAGNLAVAGNQGYRNGGADGLPIGPFLGAPPTHNIYIGARNNVGVLNLPINADIQAVAIYDCTLTAPQVAAVAAAMAAL